MVKVSFGSVRWIKSYMCLNNRFWAGLGLGLGYRPNTQKRRQKEFECHKLAPSLSCSARRDESNGVIFIEIVRLVEELRALEDCVDR